MRPAGSPAKAKQTGGLRPASEGMNKSIPTVEEFDRWHKAGGAPRLRFPPWRRVPPSIHPERAAHHIPDPIMDHEVR